MYGTAIRHEGDADGAIYILDSRPEGFKPLPPVPQTHHKRKFYSSEKLEGGKHNLTIVTQLSGNSTYWFDFLTYNTGGIDTPSASGTTEILSTYPPPIQPTLPLPTEGPPTVGASSAGSSSGSLGAKGIIGIVIGGAMALFILLFLSLCCRRQSLRRAERRQQFETYVVESLSE